MGVVERPPSGTQLDSVGSASSLPVGAATAVRHSTSTVLVGMAGWFLSHRHSDRGESE